MPNIKNNKPILTVLLTVGLTGAVVFAFSNPTLSAKLKKMGLQFPAQSEITNTWFPSTAIKSAARPKLQVKKQRNYDSLSVAEKLAIDTLKSKVNFLENFLVTPHKSALSNFFHALDHRQDSTVHIWYYGDSQIEGDRITQDLRTLMQADFGGSGLGYVPFSDVASYRTIELKPGNSWFKLNCFVNKTPKGFGFAGKVFKLNVNDSNFKANTGIWISPSQKYQSLWLLYGNSKGGKVSLNGKDSEQRKISIQPTNTAEKVLLSSKPLYGIVQIQVPSATNYYGYLLEGNGGIQVDNCGIRGHSGDGLQYISDNIIQSQARQLNTHLVVFHFGNNMVPYIKANQNIEYFRKEFESMFSRYRRLLPNASFLVISPGDMGFVSNDQAFSYPGVTVLAEALRKAAENTGCAFFDMQALMVKDGGILAWVKRGYANLDGHLSAAGQMKFAKAMYGEIKKEMQVETLLNKIQ